MHSWVRQGYTRTCCVGHAQQHASISWADVLQQDSKVMVKDAQHPADG